MDKIIFVMSDNNVDTYSVNIDEQKIRNIQSSIDIYNGKGDILEGTGGVDFFSTFCFIDKKVEVVSSNYVRTVQTCDYCCGEVSDIDVYNYKYYAYKQHRLSTLCDELLKTFNSLDLSYIIRELLEYKPETELEQIFLNQLIRAIRLEKVSINDVIELDLTPVEKSTFLTRIRGALRKNDCEHLIITCPTQFEDTVNQRISDIETINEAFYSRELCGQPFQYTDQEKICIKRKVLSSIPSISQLSHKITND